MPWLFVTNRVNDCLDKVRILPKGETLNAIRNGPRHVPGVQPTYRELVFGTNAI